LATELSSGGIGTALFAFALGALHALTPGHGKTALATYFLARQARVGKGVRVALSAATLHVISGVAVFLALRFVVGQTSNITGRGSPSFAALGYGLIVAAGALMLVQSLRPARPARGEIYALTAGIGFLPCPLTISVLGFAWAQATVAMVGLVVLSLALGIATTIAVVAVAAILARGTVGAAVADRLPDLERWARLLQGMAGLAIMAIGAYTLATLR
jgi:ABC-type nickel/cobalt efflux system permease component RcnA